MGSPETFQSEYKDCLLTKDVKNGGALDRERLLGDDADKDSTQQEKRRMLVGYGAGFLGVFMISAGLAFTQALDQSIPHSELNGFRFIAQFLIASPLLVCFNKCDISVKKNFRVWVLIGCCFMTVTSYAKYGSAYYLPLGVASGVSRSLTLVFNYFITCVVKKTIRWYELVATAVAITGVFMVTQPPFIFHDMGGAMFGDFSRHSLCRIVQNGSLNATSELHYLGVQDEVIGYILCVVEAVVCAMHIQLVNRKLQGFSPILYNFWTGLFGMVISFIAMVLTETPTFPSKCACIVFVCVHVVAAGSYGIFQYTSYQMIPPLVTALIMTLQIPSTFILQYTALASLHPGHANIVEICGAVLVFAAIALVPAYELVKLNRETANGKL